MNRFDALATYEILDTPREQRFDDIVRLAADICDAPMGAVCLVAEQRQWFKAEIGLGLEETPLDVSICAHAILQSDVFVVPDTTKDERFAGNPIVTGEPHVRFYAGALLETADGLPLGTLCVLDTVPRPNGVSEGQRRALKTLAAQVMMQLELKRSQARDLAHKLLLDQAQRTAGLGVWQWKVGTQDCSWSDELFRIAGRESAKFKVTLDSALACLHPDDREPLYEWLLGPAQDDTCPDHGCRIVRPDGEVRHCWVTRSLIRGKNGTIVAISGLCQDITESKKGDEARRESEMRLRSIFNHARVGILLRDLDQRVLMVNDHFCEFVGCDPEDLIGLLVDAFTHPEDQAWNRPLYDVHQKTGEPFRVEKRYLRPDGTVVWCAVHVSFVRDEQGEVSATIAVAEDITARRAAEEELRDSRELLQTVIDSVADLIFVKDREGYFAFANRAAVESLGVLPGYRDEDFLTEDRARGYVADDRQVMASGELRTIDERIPINGRDHIFHTVKVPWRREGEIIGVIGVARDITERQRAEEALRQSEERLRLAVRVTALGIWDYDARTDTPSWSPDLRLIFGIAADAPADLETFLSLVHPDDRANVVAQHRAVHAPSVSSEFELVFRIQRASDGAWRWITEAGRKIFDDTGTLIRVISSLRDVTEQRTAEDRIRWAAMHDPLTQLPNRFLFQEKLDQAIQRPITAGHKLGLLLLDVDHFKQINDTFGHDAGDAVLKAFGERLRAVLRKGDMVARLGGDEFGVVLQNIDGVADIHAVVGSILERLRDPFVYDGRIVECRASIGASLYPDHAGNSQDLLKHADIALYTAKATTAGELKVFDPMMHDRMQRRFSMNSAARTAIDAGRIIPFYQPKIEFSSGKIAGFEALLRWKDERNCIQRPASIEAAFEDLNLATALGNCMLECVVSDMQRWLDQGLDFGHVALNASAAEFRHDDLAERILRRLQSANVPTCFLELEVTETVFLGRGAEYVGRALRTLSAEGVRIALDDFGTGYASLLHLKQFPVNIIKIDQSFVRDLDKKGSDAAIVRAILNLGQNLGIEIVAEGIETPAQAAFLGAQGCDYGQGHLFAKPTQAAEIMGLIASWAPTEARRQWAGRRDIPATNE